MRTNLHTVRIVVRVLVRCWRALPKLIIAVQYLLVRSIIVGHIRPLSIILVC